MPKGKIDESMLAKCPYYKCESKCIVYCEGVEENNCIHMAFATPPQKRDFEKEFCRAGWWKCIIAAALNRRYGYEM